MGKGGLRFSFRMGEECDVVNTDQIKTKLSGSMSTLSTSIFKDPSVAKQQSCISFMTNM